MPVMEGDGWEGMGSWQNPMTDQGYMPSSESTGGDIGPAGSGPTITTTDPLTGQQAQAANSLINPVTGQPNGSQSGAGTQPFDLSTLLNQQVLGIPILYIGIGIAIWYFFFRKGGR
jgi:hypothetical protein